MTHDKISIMQALVALGFLVLIFLVVGGLVINRGYAQEIKIGYFHGGRVNMIYRTHINGYFDKEDIQVKLYTMDLRGDEVILVPKSHAEFEKLSEDKISLGKIRGTEIVEKIVSGEFDGGTIGESSFILSISEGLPIVVVAWLGYDRTPGKAILIRSDLKVKVNSPDDLRGMTLVSRRAGPGDAIFLREFLEDINLDPEKDVTIIDQVDEDYVKKWLEEGEIDGGLYHLAAARTLVQDGTAYVYRPMDWMDSQLSSAVLVFHKDFVEDYPDQVQKVVNAYMKRIKFEKELPEEEKDRSWDKGLMMVGEFEGMSIPYYDYPPLVRIGLLEEMQDLLLKYNEIDEKIDLSEFIDNSFVEKIYEEIK